VGRIFKYALVTGYHLSCFVLVTPVYASIICGGRAEQKLISFQVASAEFESFYW